jgi:hypothetical protein
VTVTQLSGVEFGFVDAKSKGMPRHGLPGIGHIDVDETERAPRRGFGGADAHQQFAAIRD